MIERFRSNILRAVLPITRIAGRVSDPFKSRDVQWADVYRFSQYARPGMVLLSRIEGEMSNLFIPGHYTHAAIIGLDGLVVEATAIGVAPTTLEQFMLTKDDVALLSFGLRLCQDEIDVANKAAGWAWAAIGSPYDYMFNGDNGDKAFFCSELVYKAYKEAELEQGKSDWTMRRCKTLGVDTVTADDFFRAADKFKLVARAPLR